MRWHFCPNCGVKIAVADALLAGKDISSFLLKVLACMGTKELCRKYGMSDATLYGWRLKYGGRNFSDARKLKQLIYTSAQQVEERRRQAG